jgi:phthalate 4,5-cis-dihydrodiol dehydrogenase
LCKYEDMAARPGDRVSSFERRVETGNHLEQTIPVRVALLGAGKQGTEVLLPALREIGNVELAAVCDPHLSSAKMVGAGTAFCSLEEAAEEVALDAVVAACPPAAHTEALDFALDRDLPIFVEKPPTVLTSELGERAALERDRGLLVGVGMNFRHAAAIEEVRSLLTSDRCGSLASLSIRYLANKPTFPLWEISLLRSVLLAQMLHPVDLAIDLAGEVLEARTRCTRRDGTYTFVSILDHDDGVVSSLVVSTAAPRFSFDLCATTDAGVSIECRNLSEVVVEGDCEDAAQGWSRRWRPAALERGYGRAGYAPQLRRFFEALRDGGGFRPGLGDLLSTYRVLDSIEDSVDAE